LNSIFSLEKISTKSPKKSRKKISAKTSLQTALLACESLAEKDAQIAELDDLIDGGKGAFKNHVSNKAASKAFGAVKKKSSRKNFSSLE